MTEFKEGKPCRKCGGTKRYGTSGHCVVCRSTYDVKHYAEHREKKKQYSAKRYVEHIDNAKAYATALRSASGPAHKTSPGNSGAAKEHRVIAYMQEQGFYAWHNSGPNSPFDVCASRNGVDVCRIEVRSAGGKRKKDRVGFTFITKAADRCDVYAIVTNDGRIYFYRGGDA